jgi:hypothetical protein
MMVMIIIIEAYSLFYARISPMTTKYIIFFVLFYKLLFYALFFYHNKIWRVYTLITIKTNNNRIVIRKQFEIRILKQWASVKLWYKFALMLAQKGMWRTNKNCDYDFLFIYFFSIKNRRNKRWFQMNLFCHAQLIFTLEELFRRFVTVPSLVMFQF